MNIKHNQKCSRDSDRIKCSEIVIKFIISLRFVVFISKFHSLHNRLSWSQGWLGLHYPLVHPHESDWLNLLWHGKYLGRDIRDKTPCGICWVDNVLVYCRRCGDHRWHEQLIVSCWRWPLTHNQQQYHHHAGHRKLYHRDIIFNRRISQNRVARGSAWASSWTTPIRNGVGHGGHACSSMIWIRVFSTAIFS